MEELLVKMSSLILVQLASSTPTVTSDMQVHLLFSSRNILVTPVDRFPEIVQYNQLFPLLVALEVRRAPWITKDPQED